MALFNRKINKKKYEKAINENEYEKYYGAGYVNPNLGDKIQKRRSSRKWWLVALGVAAAVTAVAFPFAIGVLATSAGFASATLTAAGITAGVVAIGLDVGLAAAYAVSSASRRAGKDAKKINKAQEKGKALNTNKMKSRASTSQLTQSLLANPEVKAAAEEYKAGSGVSGKEITVEQLVNSVDTKYINQTLADKLRTANDTTSWTESEIKHLLAGLRPSDQNAKSNFGGNVNFTKSIFMGDVITKDASGNVENKSIGKCDLYSEEGKLAYQAVMSYVQMSAERCGINMEVTQPFLVADNGVKGKIEIAQYNKDTFKACTDSLALYSAGREKGAIANPTRKERIAAVFGR